MTEADIQNLKEYFVNSPRFSDVLFTFPAENETSSVIYGHKAILSTNCVKFDMLFTGDFADVSVVCIDDMKYTIFLEVIKYIYTRALELSTKNMLDLLIAAQSYMLVDMQQKLEQFIMQNVTTANLTDILNASEFFDNTDIAALCCDLICDNPLHYLKNAQLLNLTPHSIKVIITQQRINCTESQLKEITLNWLNHYNNEEVKETEFNEATYGKLHTYTSVERWQLGPKALFNLNTEFNNGNFKILPFACNLMYIKNHSKIYLHGFGLHTGLFPDLQEQGGAFVEPQYFEETILINIFEVDPTQEKMVHRMYLKRNIKQKSTVFIENILFEKLELTNNFHINVDFGEKKSRTTISSAEQSWNVDKRLQGTVIDGIISKLHNNCLAYLLTSSNKIGKN
jgi:hypothetical protein